MSTQLRWHDLEIMERKVYGSLVDLAAMASLPADFPVNDVGVEIRRRYEALWHEVTRTETVTPEERFRIRDRIRALNTLGFSVDEVELTAVQGGERLRMHAFVDNRSCH